MPWARIISREGVPRSVFQKPLAGLGDPQRWTIKLLANPVQALDDLWPAHQLALQGMSSGEIDQTQAEYNRKYALSR